MLPQVQSFKCLQNSVRYTVFSANIVCRVAPRVPLVVSGFQVEQIRGSYGVVVRESGTTAMTKLNK